jgi:uncharacterized membrane protein YgdD (TMEM256/DUF423 family)
VDLEPDSTTATTMPYSSSNSSSGDNLRKIAAVLGASGVAVGALGAHALKETLNKRGTLASFQTATLYQLFHATAILALSASASAASNNKRGDDLGVSPLGGNLMAVGTVLFSGSIYCLSLGIGPKALLGPTTPIGGLFMVAGWVAVGLS